MPYPRQFSFCGTHHTVKLTRTEGAAPRCGLCEDEKHSAVVAVIEQLSRTPDDLPQNFGEGEV